MTYPNQDFRMGDKVFLLHKGVFGKVTHISCSDRYRVKVEYEFQGYNDYDYFDDRGFADDCCGIPFLYHDEVKIGEAPKRKFTPALIGKTLVITTKDDVVIGKVTHETVNQLTIDQHPTIRKSVIKTIHDLGEEIKL